MRGIQTLLIVFLALPESGRCCGQTSDAQPSTGAPEPAISLRTLPPARVVYREHVGPYWSLGPVFTLMREKMTASTHAGPMFIRFLENPGAIPADALRAQVGFFVNGNESMVTLPDVMESRPEELAAVLFVPGPFALSARQYARMQTWADGQGLHPVGPLTEVYWDGPLTRDRPVAGVELQLPLRLKDDETTESTTADSSSISTAHTGEPPVPDELFSDLLKESEPAEPKGTSSPDLPPSEKARTDVAAERQPKSPCEFADLFAQDAFYEIASRFMPEVASRQAASRAFLGDVVLRIRAAARGIEKVHPGEGARLSALAHALDQNFQKIVAASLIVEPSYTVEADATLAHERRQVLRELNNMLGKITHRQLHEEDVLQELSRILARSCKVLRFSGN